MRRDGELGDLKFDGNGKKVVTERRFCFDWAAKLFHKLGEGCSPDHSKRHHW